MNTTSRDADALSPVATLGMLFPGQGSQFVGMLAELAAQYPSVRATFDEASDGAGQDLWSLAQNGPAEELNRTEQTQPALLAADVAVWRVWRECEGPVPACMAGHSLGEYSALVCAGVLSLHDAAGLVAERGRLMQAAVPQGQGAMAAIIGGEDEQIAAVCAQIANGHVVSPANYNAPGQLVIAGHVGAVDKVLAALAEAGIRKAIKLDVSVPSHCALMRDAADKLAERMADLQWNTPQIPVIQNADATVHGDVTYIRAALERQLYMPVRWTESIEALARASVSTMLECGPGKVLSGLVRRIDKSVSTHAIGTPAAMQTALAEYTSTTQLSQEQA